ncbi:MAG: gephyrin-like molybdotransferase Glp, partial [Kangiellaceae bacterium]|nr:gephyrin-like molybdotransferase Glp [Kangiellaceae bacterium]
MTNTDFCYSPELMSFEQALGALINQVDCIAKPEPVDTLQAEGRIAAENVEAPINVPNFPNSAMDGYALHSSDLEKHSTFRCVGKSFAGIPYDGDLKPGECIRIMTGAVVPDSCDAVEMQENVSVINEENAIPTVSFNQAINAGQHIRPVGNDITAGQTVIKQGTRLTSSHIGLLASLGMSQVNVFKPIKVAVFTTGDELQPLTNELSAGQIYDSNRYMLMSFLAKYNFDIINLGLIGDDPEAIYQTLVKGDEQADVIITSGGVSVGEADFVKAQVERLGTLNLWKVAIKPGKPFAFGKLPKSLFLGLPGNPVSTYVTLSQLAKPMLNKLQGEFEPVKRLAKATLTETIKRHTGRKEFQRGLAEIDGNGNVTVKAQGNQSSGVLSSV